MPPKTPIMSSLQEVKKRVSYLEDQYQPLKNSVNLIELPGDTVAQEVECLRRNAERTLDEMRELRQSIFAWGRKTKQDCKVYADAMQLYFKQAQASIIVTKKKTKNKGIS